MRSGCLRTVVEKEDAVLEWGNRIEGRPGPAGEIGRAGRLFGSVLRRPIRRRRRRRIDITHPGIPGADNRWFPSRGQARQAALRRAAQLGEGCAIVWNPPHAPGQLAHYHITCPGVGRVSGHFYYGRRPPRKAPPGARPRQRGQSRREAETGMAMPATARRWYPNRTAAQQAARRTAAHAGPRVRVVWHPPHIPGQAPHFVVARPGRRGRIIRRFFYRGRPTGPAASRQRWQDTESGGFLDAVIGALTPKLPPDLTRYFITHARFLFAVYGPRLRQLVERAKEVYQRGGPAMTPQRALFAAARSLNIPRRVGRGHPGKLTGPQVRQAQQRRWQRLPGRRRKRQFHQRRF